MHGADDAVLRESIDWLGVFALPHKKQNSYFPVFIAFHNKLYSVDDKKLGGVLKKMGFTEMKQMEEVNIFKDDGTVIHIKTPKSK